MYILNRVLGVDDYTGLSKELRFTELAIRAKTKTIEISWEVVLVSPNGIVMGEPLEAGSFIRYNSETKDRYDQLEISAIGQGIKQMLTIDLAAWPIVEQQP